MVIPRGESECDEFVARKLGEIAKIGCFQPVLVSVRLGLVAAKNVPARRQQLRKGCVSYSLRGLAESRRGCLTTEGNATTVYREHATFRPE